MPDTVADPQHDITATYARRPGAGPAADRRVVAGSAGATHTPTAPFTGAPIAMLPVSTRPTSPVRSSWPVWPSAAGPGCRLRDRSSMLLRFHDLVLDRQSELLDLIQIECGKARAHAFEEVADVALVARHYARRASRLPASRAGAAGSSRS